MMIQRLLIVLLFVSSYANAQNNYQLIDVSHYEFNVNLNDTTGMVVGKATIDFTPKRNTSSIVLNLVKKREDKKGMDVSGVSLDKQTLSFTHFRDELKINFPQALNNTQSYTITVYYKGIPADGLIFGKNKNNKIGFFADHWPNRARHWLPCNDHPSDKAAVDFIVTAPNHYQVVANGIETEVSNLPNNLRLTHYKESTPLPTKVMVIGVADFARELVKTVNGIPVYSWVYAEDREKGFNDYGVAADILPFYINKVGPYAYQKLANVQSKTRFGGLENANTIFYYENSVNGLNQNEALMAHEIAHQWFGNSITETDWRHIWLSEGFATYFTQLYMSYAHGADTALKISLQNREKALEYAHKASKAIVDTTYADPMDLLNPNSYEKAGWVLKMLHQQIGDSLFWATIQKFYSAYAGKNAATEDFIRMTEEVSGKNLQTFFKQWLYQPQHPILRVNSNYNSSTQQIEIDIIQEQSYLFDTPLQIELTTNEGKITKAVQLKEKVTHVAIALPSPTFKIKLDPQARLFYELVNPN